MNSSSLMMIFALEMMSLVLKKVEFVLNMTKYHIERPFVATFSLQVLSLREANSNAQNGELLTELEQLQVSENTLKSRRCSAEKAFDSRLLNRSIFFSLLCPVNQFLLISLSLFRNNDGFSS